MSLYFAYGSNMDTKEMKRLCTNEYCKLNCNKPAYSKKFNARLENYELTFNRCSTKRKCGVCDIVKRNGVIVEGVVYDIPEKCWCALRRKEGYPTAYYEIALVVRTVEGNNIEVFSYTVKRKSGQVIRPNKKYKKHILDGAKYHGLNERYIREELEPIRTTERHCKEHTNKNYHNEMASIVKLCINKVGRDFICNPWHFYSESDVHAILYNYLKQSLEERNILYVRNQYRERFNILYREFPTQEKYCWTGKKKRRANYDLAILDRRILKNQKQPTAKKDFSKCIPIIGIEVKVNVTDKRWKKEMKKCFDKLKEIKEPQNRFIIFFARRKKFKFYDELRKWVIEKGSINVKYVRVHPKRWGELDSDDEWL